LQKKVTKQFNISTNSESLLVVSQSLLTFKMSTLCQHTSLELVVPLSGAVNDCLLHSVPVCQHCALSQIDGLSLSYKIYFM